MKKLLTLVLLTAFLCSCQPNLEEQLVGSWQNITLNVQMNTAQGQDTTTYLVVEEGQWEEILEIKPILTTFLADGTFTSEYFGLDGKPMGTEAGEWSVKKDSLIMFSEAYTGSYKVILNGNRVRFISYLDWDQDGAPDDLYDGWQERVTR
jgi:hypothetical protein